MAQAVDIIQPYLSTSLSEVRFGGSTDRERKTKLTTNHLRIMDTPVIITNCSPVTVVEYLNPTLSARTSSNKSQLWESIVCVKMLKPTILAKNIGTILKTQHEILLPPLFPPSKKCLWGSRVFLILIIAAPSTSWRLVINGENQKRILGVF